MSAPQRILIVTDSDADTSRRRALEKVGFDVSVEGDSARALAILTNASFDLLIIDINEAKQGVDLLHRVRGISRLERLPILTIAEWGTGQPTIALSGGADAFEPKPINGARLVAAVEKLLRPRMVMTAKASARTRESDTER